MGYTHVLCKKLTDHDLVALFSVKIKTDGLSYAQIDWSFSKKNWSVRDLPSSLKFDSGGWGMRNYFALLVGAET